MKRCFALCALAAVFTLSRLPAGADPESDALNAKLASAWQGVKSFKFTMQPPAGSDAAASLHGGMITTTMVLPDKMEVVLEISGVSSKNVVLNGQTWNQMNRGEWRRIPSGFSMFKQTDATKYIDQIVVKTLPDEDFNGKKVGAYTSSVGSAKTGVSVCNYDKTSYLLVRCHSAMAFVLFSDFNSASNVIDVPN